MRSVLLACGLAAGGAGGAEARPGHPWLADSVWPMAHGHPFNQDATTVAGPAAAGGTGFSQLAGPPVAVTLALSGPYADGRRALWSATREDVSRIDPVTWRYLARLKVQRPAETGLSGAYTLVDRDGRLHLPAGDRLETYGDARAGDRGSAIVPVGVWTIPAPLKVAAEEALIGLSMSWDGALVTVTSHGLVAVVSLDHRLLAAARLEDGTARVSNSLAVDEAGGIYVVTAKALHKIVWDGAGLSHAWAVDYPSDSEPWIGHLGSGSGTTPTLMDGAEAGPEHRLVAIADGRRRMHLMLVWADRIPEDWAGLPGRSRRVAAVAPVDFGTGDDRAVTEQSLAVSGHGIGVVSNTYGELTAVQKLGIRRECGSTPWCLTMGLIYLSNEPNLAPFGMARYDWDPAGRTLARTWTNPRVSCPNGIPLISTAPVAGAEEGVFYCIGQRRADWTLEAVDWRTGAGRAAVKAPCPPLVRCHGQNSFYAGLIPLGEGRLASGAYGGPMRFATP